MKRWYKIYALRKITKQIHTLKITHTKNDNPLKNETIYKLYFKILDTKRRSKIINACYDNIIINFCRPSGINPTL
jgi:hypothetical protein